MLSHSVLMCLSITCFLLFLLLTSLVFYLLQAPQLLHIVLTSATTHSPTCPDSFLWCELPWSHLSLFGSRNTCSLQFSTLIQFNICISHDRYVSHIFLVTGDTYVNKKLLTSPNDTNTIIPPDVMAMGLEKEGKKTGEVIWISSEMA